ncbi:hypothetical protein [Mycobacterium sp. 3519A]|uniref:hypothetical protein n=1 Tax=Mycobacterium sp. 3519A TaxID=2057184 RepID=UPI000C7D67F7|nr:hypothetical protein [Mycobacterium sp. 3519A]
MLTIESRVHVRGLTAEEVISFLLNCTDSEYQKWWPGTHFQLHTLRVGAPDHVDDVVLMDEMIGSHHLRLAAVVVEVEPGRKVVWRMKKAIRLPARLTLDLTDQHDGVEIRHSITVGWRSRGQLFDPLFRLYFTPRFAAAMDAHVKTEFPRLGNLLHPPNPLPVDRR